MRRDFEYELGDTYYIYAWLMKADACHHVVTSMLIFGAFRYNGFDARLPAISRYKTVSLPSTSMSKTLKKLEQTSCEVFRPSLNANGGPTRENGFLVESE